MRRAVPSLFSAVLATAPLAAGPSHETSPSHQTSHQTSQETAHERREPPATCAVVEIESDSKPRRGHGFRATRMLGLEFETRLVGRLERERTLRLRVYTPQGFLYQVLEVPIEHQGQKRRRLEARLPVAGTSIMASGLYGRWKVVPHLDDRREPCGTARNFVIEP